jgi:predicted aldo/keto reductase-like oxidoreductase
VLCQIYQKEFFLQSKINTNNGDHLSILGFGCMRFPKKAGGIDEPRAINMIRTAIDRGVNYFDTAYIYHSGKSESLLGTALLDGYREKVKIATKLPPFMVFKLEHAEKIFKNQLTRLKTDKIDYYLLHMLTDKAMFDRMASLGILKWMEELKTQGLIGNIGFSFHGGKSDFEAIIKAYPWDFCQIQYNYLDENRQATKSGLLLAHTLGIPVIVMEPLRGGKLADNLPREAMDIFKSYDPHRSPAQWALRWVWNHHEVNLLLSGMSTEEQLDENIRMAGEMRAGSLSEKELEVFNQVKTLLMEKTKIPCTTCGYCMPCPFGVDIPSCFSAYNDKYLLSNKNVRLRYMQNLGAMSQRPANASVCTECGKCLPLCPQQIDIPGQLKTVASEFEGPLYKPLVRIARRFLRVKG